MVKGNMKSLLLLILLCLPGLVFSQYLEAGVSGGLSLYSGDIVSYEFQNRFFVSIGPSAGVLVRHNTSDFFSARAGIQYARISAADTDSQYETRRIRNLSFRTDIIEISFMAEYNILGYQPVYDNKIWSPYIFAGLTGFYFNPKALYQGNWEALQPLGTEGQGMLPNKDPYSRIHFAIPMGEVSNLV